MADKGKLVVLALPGQNGTFENNLELTASEWALRMLWGATAAVEKALTPPAHFRVAMFGSSRIARDTNDYRETKWFAGQVAGAGIDVVTGGGMGLMEAANAGAIEGRRGNKARSIGLSIGGALDGKPNPHLDKEYFHEKFFSRLHDFCFLASAFVVMPRGGIGTLAEVGIVWQLAQFAQTNGSPFILVGPMWRRFVEFMQKEMVDDGTVKPEELALATLVPTVREALPIILEAHSRFIQKRAAG